MSSTGTPVPVEGNVMVRAAFIGAGRRARSAHYPALSRLPSEIELAAICELDPERLATTADMYDIEGRYADFRIMLEREDPDVVYAVTPPQQIADIAVEVLNAGKHIFIEKPPGIGSADAERIAEAAQANTRIACVGLQRRWTPLTRAARARVEANGPVMLVNAGMSKNLLVDDGGGRVLNRLYEQDIHVVDFMRWLCGGSWDEVLTRGDTHYTGWPSTYNSIIHFTNGAVGVHSVTGHAGARHYRIEMHGNGISAYLRPPVHGEIFSADSSEPETLEGPAIPGDPEGKPDDGIDALHADFLDAIANERQPLTNIHDVIHSMRLLEEMGQLDPTGKPRRPGA